jgi:hypothetical protein
MTRTSEDASRQLQRGVLAAVMHIASVRDAGAAPLAIEFSAALEQVRRTVSDASTPDDLRKSFESWLPVPLLKAIAQHYVAGDRRLLAVLEPEQLAGIDQRYRAQYESLVIAAAEAALKAQIDKSWYRRRYVARWERSALEDIKKAFQQHA